MNTLISSFPFSREALSARDCLLKIVTKKEIELLSDLFDRLGKSPEGVDAAQFRIDHQDQRQAIENLVNNWLINQTTNTHPWLYRLEFVALPLVESHAATTLLDVSEKILRYLKQKYEQARDESITVEEMSKDLDVQEASIQRVLSYLVRTPVVGARDSGDPNSSEWSMLPNEKSLDYSSVDLLLNQLIAWLPANNFATRGTSPIRNFLCWVRGLPIWAKIFSLLGLIAAVVSYMVDILDLIDRFP